MGRPEGCPKSTRILRVFPEDEVELSLGSSTRDGAIVLQFREMLTPWLVASRWKDVEVLESST